MGNQSCCAADVSGDKVAQAQASEMQTSEAVQILDPAYSMKSTQAAQEKGGQETYEVTLDKSKVAPPGNRLGLDVDYMAERNVLPLINITGGLAEQWNKDHPDKHIRTGDSIIQVNGLRGDVPKMLDMCKSEQILNLVIVKSFTYDTLVRDLEALVTSKQCGPLLIRLSWHDAGVYGKGSGGCPNAAMRFLGAGEAAFPANAGLPTVALGLLQPISNKYCPDLISHADLWTLAANISIRLMGGPDVLTRFGRPDAKSAKEGAASQAGLLPDGDKGAQHLRDIFHMKGFRDQDIVALSGAHTVGMCHLDRSGFEGKWTENHLKFDNAYFKDLLSKTYTAETTAKGLPQHRHGASQTVMLISDLALIQDPIFKQFVEKYAANQDDFFRDFADAWTRLQENGCVSLRDIL